MITRVLKERGASFCAVEFGITKKEVVK